MPFQRLIFYKYVVGIEEKRVARVLGFTLGIFAVCFLAASHDGLLVTMDESFGLLEDLGFFSNLIANFFLVIYTAKLPSFFARTFAGELGHFNYNNGVLSSVRFNSKLTQQNYEQEYSKLWSLITCQNSQGKLLFYLLFFTGITANILTEIGIYNGRFLSWSYQGTHILTFTAQILLNISNWWFIYPESIYLIITTMYSLISLVLQLSEGQTIILTPISRDERGGLISITEFCLHFVKLLFFPLLFIFGYTLVMGFRFELFGGLLLYILLLIAAFVVPLQIIHKSMWKCRERELLQIEVLFRKYYTRYQDLMKNNISEKDLKAITETLVSVESLFNVTKRLPLWPYDWSLLSRFLSIIIIPLVLFVIQLLVNSDSILFNVEKLTKLKELFR